MIKILIIETCSGCPFFNDAYVSYGMKREWCKKENQAVPWIPGGTKNRGSYPIPDFCKLPNKEDNEHKDL